MKFFRILISLLAAGFIFSSCQKEFTIEATTAKGSLQKDSTGDCMPSLVNGVYAKDSLLKASNYVDITVQITQTGSYSITTDTVNGYSFSAAGDVGIIGINTIRLLGKGRPFAGGVDVFKIKFDSSICEFNVVVSGTGGGGGGGSANFIKANIDGATTITTFDVGDTAVFDNTTFTGFAGYGITGADSSGDSIRIAVGTPGTTGPAIGTAYNVSQPVFTAGVLGNYKDILLNNFSATTMAMNPMPYFTVTITSVTATRLTGTFSGAMFMNGTGPGTKTFTNGSFSVPKQ